MSLLGQEEKFEITCNDQFSLLAWVLRFGRHRIGKERLQRLPYADAISKVGLCSTLNERFRAAR